MKLSIFFSVSHISAFVFTFQVASDDPVDWAEQAPASLAIQGLIRPALIEEHSVIQKHLSDHQSDNDGIDEVGRTVEDDLEDPVTINGYKSGTSKDSPVSAEELENKQDEARGNGTTFYKLEMVKIQLFSSHGNQVCVRKDFTCIFRLKWMRAPF